MDICSDDALKLDYLNGLLPEKDRVRFEEHLAACPGCRREIAELRNTVAAIASVARPSVPEAWTAAAKNRLRAERSSPISAVSAGPTAVRRRTSVFQYTLISAGVTAALVLLSWLVMGGTVERWFPALTSAALGISDPRTARIVDLVVLVLSLHALMFVPSIIDNIYQLLQRSSRRHSHGLSARFFAC